MTESRKSDAAPVVNKDDANAIASDDPHKTETLTKLGREDLDPDEGSH